MKVKINRPTNKTELYVNSFAGNLRDRADEDYISARLCYFHGLLENFFWDAQQCVEKYLKATALYHRIDVRNQRHDLKQLFKKIDAKLKLKAVDTHWPSETNCLSRFREEEFLNFLERLTALGLNRYCTNSYNSSGDEIVKLDATVFIIRGYCQPINIGNKTKDPLQNKIKACIDEGRNFAIHGFLQEVLTFEPRKELKRWLVLGNSFFKDSSQKTCNIPSYSKSYNHILSRQYYQAKEGSREDKLLFIELSEFLLDHIHWPNDLKSELEELIRKTYKELVK